MRIVQLFLIILFMLLVLLFSIQNHEQTVSLRFFNWTSPNLSLDMVMYIAFAFGVLMCLFVLIWNILKLKSRAHALQKENKKIKDELIRMRNVNIDDELESTETDEEEDVERKALGKKKR
ncbi:MAG TPA: LapA family protein [bacterium]